MNFYKRYPGDYARDTGHLSLTEHGAYSVLLDRYYSTGSLPSEKGSIYTLCRAVSKLERRAVDKILLEFFPAGRNPRADEEIQKWNEKSAANSLIGKLGGRPKKNQNANRTQTVSVSERFPDEKPPEARSQIPEEDSRRGEAPSVDQAIFADARLIFGKSIGGQIGKAIKAHGKPWVVGVIDACRSKDPEAARAYLAAAMNGVHKPDEAAQRRVIP